MDENDKHLARSRAAVERLERAVQRLETAMARKNGDLFLADELRVTREDYARLDEATRHVEAELDSVIGNLRAILKD